MWCRPIQGPPQLLEAIAVPFPGVYARHGCTQTHNTLLIADLVDLDFVFPLRNHSLCRPQPATPSFPHLESLHKQLAHGPNHRLESQRGQACVGPSSIDRRCSPRLFMSRYKEERHGGIPTIRPCYRALCPAKIPPTPAASPLCLLCAPPYGGKDQHANPH